MIYGVVLLWPSVIEAVQTANASLPLTLLVAIMWRYRERAAGRRARARLRRRAEAVPLAGRDLARAVGRVRGRGGATVAAAASLLLLLPFTSIGDYVRLLRNLGETFEHDAYTPFALLADLGVPDGVARGATIGLGAGVLALAWRRRSLGLALAAALVLSPIVWRHFFTLLIVPLALTYPRFAAVWLIPIAMWIGDGTLNGAPWQNAGVLALAALTIVLCERRADNRHAVAIHVRPAHA